MSHKRVRPFTVASDLFATTTFILSIPHVKTQAIVVWPGLERSSQIKHAIKAWQTGEYSHLLIAGYHEPDIAEREFNAVCLAELFGITDTTKIHTQIHASNSKDQGEWVADTVRQLGIKSISLFVPAFHLVRAYLVHIVSFSERRM